MIVRAVALTVGSREHFNIIINVWQGPNIFSCVPVTEEQTVVGKLQGTAYVHWKNRSLWWMAKIWDWLWDANKRNGCNMVYSMWSLASNLKQPEALQQRWSWRGERRRERDGKRDHRYKGPHATHPGASWPQGKAEAILRALKDYPPVSDSVSDLAEVWE